MPEFKLFGLLLVLSVLAVPARPQTAAPARDPNAVALAGRALQALAAAGTTLQDVTLQGSVKYSVGSKQETGTATLVARGHLEGLVTLNLPTSVRKEIRQASAGVLVGSNGVPWAMAPANCYRDADCFFPALSLAALATDSSLVINLVGEETHAGQSVYHLTLFHDPQEQPAGGAFPVQRVSQVDLYMDTASLLPSALDFSDHARNDPAASIDIPTEIRFSAYQSFGGVMAPTRIQEFVARSLVLDFTVEKVQVNSGVADSTFALPRVPVLPTNAGAPSGAAGQ